MSETPKTYQDYFAESSLAFDELSHQRVDWQSWDLSSVIPSQSLIDHITKAVAMKEVEDLSSEVANILVYGYILEMNGGSREKYFEDEEIPPFNGQVEKSTPTKKLSDTELLKTSFTMLNDC